MSFHVQPSERLKALIEAHVGPAPCPPPDRTHRFMAEHPFVQWVIRRDQILVKAIQEALEPMKATIEAEEERHHDRVNLGEVPVEVLGRPCRWVNASCSLLLGSYMGEVVLESEN